MHVQSSLAIGAMMDFVVLVNSQNSFGILYKNARIKFKRSQNWEGVHCIFPGLLLKNTYFPRILSYKYTFWLSCRRYSHELLFEGTKTYMQADEIKAKLSTLLNGTGIFHFTWSLWVPEGNLCNIHSRSWRDSCKRHCNMCKLLNCVIHKNLKWCSWNSSFP